MADNREPLERLLLLQRMGTISGMEYGLLAALGKGEVLDQGDVEDLLRKVEEDRLALAQGYLTFAQAVGLDSGMQCRQVISRCYYAMHHAARAVIYQVKRKDVPSHEGVIVGIGKVMDEDAKRTLRQQHKLRNQVEYEVYLPELDLVQEAQKARSAAARFVGQCQHFLEARRQGDDG